MNYSSFVLTIMLLSHVRAAPQNPPACDQIPANPAADQIGAQYLQIPGCSETSTSRSSDGVGNPTRSNSNAGSASISAPASTAPANPQQPSTNTTVPESGGGKCPVGFRNTVFNTGAPRNAGWPQTTWNSLTSNGVDDWGKLNCVAGCISIQTSTDHDLLFSRLCSRLSQHNEYL